MNTLQVLLESHLKFSVQDKVVIDLCVSRYSKPKSACQCLTYLFYRIWNAVKSLFNKSDWQKANVVLAGQFKTFQHVDYALFLLEEASKAFPEIKPNLQKMANRFEKIKASSMYDQLVMNALDYNSLEKFIKAYKCVDYEYRVLLLKERAIAILNKNLLNERLLKLKSDREGIDYRKTNHLNAVKDADEIRRLNNDLNTRDLSKESAYVKIDVMEKTAFPSSLLEVLVSIQDKPFNVSAFQSIDQIAIAAFLSHRERPR